MKKLTILCILPLLIIFNACNGNKSSMQEESAAYYNSAISWYDKGNIYNAIADYNRAIKITPNDASAYVNRGAAWAKQGKIKLAIADYDRAIKIDRDFEEAFFNRGLALQKTKKYQNSISDYKKVLQINPQNAKALNNLAWLLATCPNKKYCNGIQAIQLAKKAVELDLTPNNLGTLAAAYAATGKFNNAVNMQKKAIDLLYKKNRIDKIDQYIKCLNSYKKNKPWIDNN